MWGSLGSSSYCFDIRKRNLDKRYFLVIGLREHLRVLGHFRLSSATMVAMRVVSFKAFLAIPSLKIVGFCGIDIVRGCGLSGWWLVERFCWVESWSRK